MTISALLILKTTLIYYLWGTVCRYFLKMRIRFYDPLGWIPTEIISRLQLVATPIIFILIAERLFAGGFYVYRYFPALYEHMDEAMASLGILIALGAVRLFRFTNKGVTFVVKLESKTTASIHVSIFQRSPTSLHAFRFPPSKIQLLIQNLKHNGIKELIVASPWFVGKENFVQKSIGPYVSSMNSYQTTFSGFTLLIGWLFNRKTISKWIKTQGQGFKLNSSGFICTL